MTWDAHCHVFGPAEVFPYPPDAPYRPTDAPLADLMRLHTEHGFGRAVLVQPAAYGRDHDALLAALAAGAGRYRGVALVDKEMPDAQVVRLDAAGVRGARVNLVAHLQTGPPVDVVALAKRIDAFGWHLALHVSGTGIVEQEELVRSLPTPVVIDHMARVDRADGPAVDALRRLLDTGRVWVKLSGADRLDMPLPDAVALARLLMRTAPERVVWGTDFPHPNRPQPAPSDAELVKAIDEIAPTPEERELLLVDNPTRLFGS